MKRMTDSCRYPAVLGSELIQRGYRIGVAKDHGNLTAFCAQGRLPLRAGQRLGGSHSGGQHVACGEDFPAGEQLAVVDFGVLPHAAQDGRFSELTDGGRRGELAGLRTANVVGAGGNGGGFLNVHGGLHVGPIPTVETSYTVTSDKSTHTHTVRREAA